MDQKVVYLSLLSMHNKPLLSIDNKPKANKTRPQTTPKKMTRASHFHQFILFMNSRVSGFGFGFGLELVWVGVSWTKKLEERMISQTKKLEERMKMIRHYGKRRDKTGEERTRQNKIKENIGKIQDWTTRLEQLGLGLGFGFGLWLGFGLELVGQRNQKNE